MNVQLNRRSILGGLIGGAASLVAGSAIQAEVLPRFRPGPGVVRLSSNENPYGPSPKALAAAARAAAKGAYYPGPIEDDLLAMIAERHGVSAENMVLSSGSNEALCAAVAAWAKKGKILVPTLTYEPHLRYARNIGADIVRVPLNDDMSINLKAMAAAVDGEVSLVYVCNPNNPTGIALDGEDLRSFCKSVGKKAVILVDEAYNELTDKPDYTSMMDLVRGGENVIVMRTFSKLYGLAGLRIGYVMAPTGLAETVRNHVMAWPNIVGIAAAIASYQDDRFIEFSRARILEGRQIVADVLERHGVPGLPSQANFIYADIGRDATGFAKRMLERNVRIRGIYQPYKTFSRISMGKIEDLHVFARVFHEVFTG